jgi:hypothetical protein
VHWLAVLSSNAWAFPDQLDRDVRQPEPHGDGDPVVPIKEPKARVETEAQGT